MKQCTVTNSSWYTNLKLPNIRAVGYKMMGLLAINPSAHPSYMGKPRINGKDKYDRYVIQKQ